MAGDTKVRDIKVVALDIYGTVLASDDHDNACPPRKGLEAFFDMCDKRGIKIASASDATIEIVKAELQECKVDINRFDSFHQLNQLPVKHFDIIIGHYDILPSNLLVIGDSYKDAGGATRIGALYLRVPEYTVKSDDNFDFSRINLDTGSYINIES